MKRGPDTEVDWGVSQVSRKCEGRQIAATERASAATIEKEKAAAGSGQRDKRERRRMEAKSR